MVKSWFQRWLGIEQRSEGYGVSRFFEMLGESVRSSSGVTVTPESAMRIAAVYCCVRLLSETVAQLPIQAYRRRRDGSKEWLPDNPLCVTLARQPNGWQTSFEFREMMMGHLLLRGNAYAQIVPGVRGAATELWPLRPDRMKVERLENGRLRYKYTLESGASETFTQDEIFHLRGLSSDGIEGLSPIAMARDPIGLTKATETYGAKYFANSAKPSGILTTDASLKEDAAKQNRAMWENVHAGADNAHRVAVLTNGLKWQAVGMSNDDSQFLELRTFQIDEIARIFRVPPHMVYEMSHATFSNIEHQKLEFAEYTILPWVIRWEGAILRDLVTEPDVYLKFNVDGLKRGDSASRAEYYSKMVQGGVFSLNDVLELEDMNPLPGPEGKAHWMQQQMVPIDILIAGPAKPEPAAVPVDEDTEDEEVTEEEARKLREQNSELSVEVGKLRGEKAYLEELSQRTQQEAADALARLHERELAAAKQAVYYDNVEQGLAQAKATCESVESRCHEQEAKCHELSQRCVEMEKTIAGTNAEFHATCMKHNAAIGHTRKIAQQAVERNRRRECDTVLRASKKPKEFLESVETFYAEEAERLAIALEGPLALREALTGEPAYASAAIDSYIKESKRQLLAVYDTVSEDRFASEVLSVTNGWEPRSAELVAQIFGKDEVAQ